MKYEHANYELDQARETIARLNRRVQAAEAALADLMAVAERIIARTDGYNRMEDADPNGYARLVELAAAFIEYRDPTQSTR